MSSSKDEKLSSRLIPPSVLRRSTTFSTKVPSTQVTARRVTQLPGSNGNNTLKRPTSSMSTKTLSIRASATSNRPVERLGALTNARKVAPSNVKSKPSLVKPVPPSSSNVPKSKILQPSQGNRNLSRTASLARNSIWSKTAGSRIKATGNTQENKSNGPIRLFLQKPDVSTNTKPPTRLTRVNPNMNRPLRPRPIATPAQKSQKPIINGASKTNTISSVRRRQTIALKDIQTQFKPNPISLQEILSSKTSHDVTKKRETLADTKIGLKPSANSGKLSIGSRSRMTYSYRVEKPRESRASIFSGALRVPRNNVNRNPRNTLIGNAMPSRTLRKSPVLTSQGKPVSKKSANQSLAAPRFMKPSQKLSTSASLRRTNTSIIGEKQTGVTKGIIPNQGVNIRQNAFVQNSATIQKVSSMANVQQVENSVRTVESLVDPLRKMSIRRFSRKSFLINDNAPSQPTSMQASQVIKENDGQQQNTNISTMRCLPQIKNKVPVRLSNDDQATSSKSVEMHNEIEFPNDISLATSIPLPPSPVEGIKKVDITKGNNNNLSSDVEKARLYEELEELEKQLEQEISEDMSEIL